MSHLAKKLSLKVMATATTMMKAPPTSRSRRTTVGRSAEKANLEYKMT